jgi:hypothetical protein
MLQNQHIQDCFSLRPLQTTTLLSTRFGLVEKKKKQTQKTKYLFKETIQPGSNEEFLFISLMDHTSTRANLIGPATRLFMI